MSFLIDPALSGDLSLRHKRLQQALISSGADALLLSSNVSLYYVSGQVYRGWFYLPAEGNPIYFIKRPVGLRGETLHYIQHPREIPERLRELGISTPGKLLIEGETSYEEWMQWKEWFPHTVLDNATRVLRKVRAVKTPWEQQQIIESARLHSIGYQQIPSLYRPGMTDLDLSIEIEYTLRKMGNLGIFRIFGSSMEIHFGVVLAGDNASEPSPYDFALGGKGLHPSIPVGENGSVIAEGHTVLVDVCGNFTGYMSDMSRLFVLGNLPKQAIKAYEVALEINDTLSEEGKPGVSGAFLYQKALSIVRKAGLDSCFMGNRQKARFVGHGVGIEVNELPVLADRSDDPLEEGMSIAIEPKFVFPGLGAIGIEDTYLVRPGGMERITLCSREIKPLIH